MSNDYEDRILLRLRRQLSDDERTGLFLARYDQLLRQRADHEHAIAEWIERNKALEAKHRANTAELSEHNKALAAKVENLRTEVGNLQAKLGRQAKVITDLMRKNERLQAEAAQREDPVISGYMKKFDNL